VGNDTDVLIVGAGPTGLVLALWLARLGVRARIVDRTSEPGTTSRALAVQGRTLELYHQIGLADTVVERGRTVAAVNLWISGRRVAHAVFGEMGTGISPYPFALVFPQDEHERLLVERLTAAGITVERQTEVVSVDDAGDRVIARLKRSDGTLETCTATYIAGCDGGHSIVRESMHAGFAGGTYARLFYVADVEAGGEVVNGDVHVGLDRVEFLAVFPLKGHGRVRLVGTVRDEADHPREKLTWDDVSQRVIDWMRIDVKRVHWFSTYRVHHRVAGTFRKGRAFLAGDAAHVHSPVGGQGMNTGIGDAVNLAWKLAAVLRGNADASILDSYETERIAFARRLVATTDRGFTGVTSTNPLIRFLRLRALPIVVPLLFRFRPTRRLMFRTVSQVSVNYRGSQLSDGHAGSVEGGDRLPWVKVSADEAHADNFAPLTSIGWQLHVYGDAAPEIRSTCEQRRLPLHEFAWSREMADAALARDAAYLVRPDGYVALATLADGAAAKILAYVAAHKLVFDPR
jgi:2-polyprenyl-6-methoxyphenol hydroxylase-like FAD-dependent oxidoreductase